MTWLVGWVERSETHPAGPGGGVGVARFNQIQFSNSPRSSANASHPGLTGCRVTLIPFSPRRGGGAPIDAGPTPLSKVWGPAPLTKVRVDAEPGRPAHPPGRMCAYSLARIRCADRRSTAAFSLRPTEGNCRAPGAGYKAARRHRASLRYRTVSR